MARKTNELIQEQFIAAYIKNLGVKSKAAAECGVPYITARSWFKKPEFVARVKEAEDQFYDTIRGALIQRAVKKSDQAAFFFLKSRYPEVYDDNIRRLKYLRDNNLADPDAPATTIILQRGDEPSRIQESNTAKEETKPALLNGYDRHNEEAEAHGINGNGNRETEPH